MRRQPIHGLQGLWGDLRDCTANAYQLVGVVLVASGGLLYAGLAVAKAVIVVSESLLWLPWAIMAVVGVGAILVTIGVAKAEIDGIDR